MQHSMAIRADRTQIFYRVHPILFANFRYRDDMVNMDKPLSNGAIAILKIEATDLARCPVVGQTSLPCIRIPLVYSDKPASLRSFKMESRQVTGLRRNEKNTCGLKPQLLKLFSDLPGYACSRRLREPVMLRKRSFGENLFIENRDITQNIEYDINTIGCIPLRSPIRIPVKILGWDRDYYARSHNPSWGDTQTHKKCSIAREDISCCATTPAIEMDTFCIGLVNGSRKVIP